MATQISKTQFLKLVRKGWRKLGYASGAYWTTWKGTNVSHNRGKAMCACAIGAAAYAAGSNDPQQWVEENFRVEDDAASCLADMVIRASDKAHSKAGALRDIADIYFGRGLG